MALHDQPYAYRLNRDFPVAKPARPTHELMRFHRPGLKKQELRRLTVVELERAAVGVGRWRRHHARIREQQKQNSRSRWEKRHGRCGI
jgi:hypothetical protein